jgi:sugar phosphate permease
VTEAGFFPGIIFYLTYWFPGRIRGHIMGLFYLAVPMALVLGGPLSGLLLDVHSGLQGWQWMFLVEGLLAVVVGILAVGLLVDRPADAKWLAEEEKRALMEVLAQEQAARRASGPERIRALFRNARVLRFLSIYALIQVGTYGVVFYLPAEVGALLHRSAGLVVGLVTAIPWIFAIAAVLVLPRAADAWSNHRNVAAAIMACAGAASFTFPGVGPVAGLMALSVAAAGFIAVQPIFWTLPTSYLADRAAAGGIALIGAGNLGGFLAPNLKVWADGLFHSHHAGFYLLAGLTLLGAVLIAAIHPEERGFEGAAH